MPCKKCDDDKYKWGDNGECEYPDQEACENANAKYKKEKKEYSVLIEAPSPVNYDSFDEYKEAYDNFHKAQELNLSAEKVKLSLVGDIKGIVSKLNTVDNESMNIVTDSGQLVKEIKGFLKDRKSEVEKQLKKIKLAIKELGTLQDKAQGLESEVNSAANDLGIDQQDIPGYVDLLDYAEDADETIADLDEVKGELDKISMNL
jgi:hypothetical protein